MEPLSAVVARVRPRVRVDEQVRREGRAPLEGLAALLTLKMAFTRLADQIRPEDRLWMNK